MTAGEYQKALNALPKLVKRVRIQETNNSGFELNFINFVEALITVEGNGLAMDVREERRRMAKLSYEALKKYPAVTNP